MITSAKGNRTAVFRRGIGSPEITLCVTRKNGQGGSIIPEHLHLPSSLVKESVRDPRVILDNKRGGIEQEVPGLRKLFIVKEVRGGLQVAGPLPNPPSHERNRWHSVPFARFD